MTRPTLQWRLDGGYSKLLDESALEVRLDEAPVSAALDLFPLSSVKQKKPIEFRFKVRRSFSGASGAGLRWKITPQAEIRAVLLFAGNPFLGNFRVPARHFAVQWDIEAKAEGSLGVEAARPFLLGFEAGTRLYQSWVSVFSEPLTIAAGLKAAWQRYPHPFDAARVQEMAEREVVRWRWEGHAQVAADLSWGFGAAWTIPGNVPLVDFQKRLAGMAGAAASVVCREEGLFTLQLRKQRGGLVFHLTRDRLRRASGALSVGVELKEPLRFDQLGFTEPEPLEVISEGLGRPLVARLNRICEDALAKRLRIGLSVSGAGWKSEKTVVHAVWHDPGGPAFGGSYQGLLEGQIPPPAKGLDVSSRFEKVRGRSVSIDLTFLDWLKLRDVRVRESKRIVTIGPTGELVFEECESLQKTSYHWDGIQFLRLVSREVTGREGHSDSALWTWAVDDEVGQERLGCLLRMALHSGIIRQFTLPRKSFFPVRIRLLLGTRFSRRGLEAVRLAGESRKWKAMVRALELADPDQYAEESFGRDWIDYAEVRTLVDRDPVQASLASRYPIANRTEAERMQVVQVYRMVKRFLFLLEHWKGEDTDYVLRSFDLGIDVPIFVFFHLLCPPEMKSSAAILNGGVEETWGDLRVFEGEN